MSRNLINNEEICALSRNFPGFFWWSCLRYGPTPDPGQIDWFDPSPAPPSLPASSAFNQTLVMSGGLYSSCRTSLRSSTGGASLGSYYSLHSLNDDRVWALPYSIRVLLESGAFWFGFGWVSPFSHPTMMIMMMIWMDPTYL